jgi:hypothetical protein
VDRRLVTLNQRREGGVIALAGPGDQGGVVHAKYRHRRDRGGWELASLEGLRADSEGPSADSEGPPADSFSS